MHSRGAPPRGQRGALRKGRSRPRVRRAMTPQATLRAWLEQALPTPLLVTHLEGLGARYEGKVRDNYTTGDGRRFLVVTDRISAFDRVLGTLPLKGQVLNRLASFWFDRTRDLVPNHAVRVADPNVLEAIECEPLPVEMVMRAYITGVTSTSMWTHYAQGRREFCGHRLPDGLRKNERLPAPVLTPSTKAAKGGHDISVSRAEVLAAGQISAADFDRAAALAEALFSFGQRHCEARGLVLADTKYEFGKRPDGEIVVIDEIHTPDSSRFWFAESYEGRLSRGEEPESFDKEYVRRHLAERGFMGDGPIPVIPDEVKVTAGLRYAEAYEAITGEAFEPDFEEPIGRIRRNLGLGTG
jgi:phosphoribosylaminoimidazole-succinocarboxamide synthase